MESAVKKGIVTYNNPQFKLLNKAVITNNDLGLPELTQILGSDDSLLDVTTFNEYGWEYYVEKLGLNDDSPLNYLTDKEKLDIGFNTDDIKKIKDVFFPTIVESETSSKISYFGSININDQKLLLLNVPKDYSEVKLYDVSDDKNPVITVNFEEKNIPYYKIFWLIITNGESDSIENINLSYISWTYSENPFRNLDTYLLSPKQGKIDICKKIIKDCWIDQSSGTLLSSKLEYYFNLYFDIAGNIDVSEWNRKVVYKSGQTVRFKGSEWESLEDNNQGNNPITSKSWIRSLNILNKISRGYVEILDEDGQVKTSISEFNPSVFTLPKSEDLYLLFDAKITKGYVLDETYDKYLIPKNIIINDREVESFGEYNNIREINFDIYKKYYNKFSVKIKNNYLDNLGSLNKSAKFRFKKYNCALTSHEYGSMIGPATFTVTKFYDLSGKKEIKEIALGEDYIVKFDFTEYLDFYPIASISERFFMTKPKTNDEIFIPGEDIEVPEKLTPENAIITLRRTANYPSVIDFIVRVRTLVYRINIEDHTGYYVNKTTEINANNSAITFKFYPTSDNKSGGISVLINGKHGMFVMKIPEGQFVDPDYYTTISMFDGTRYRLSMFDLEGNDKKYYMLTVNYNSPEFDEDSTINEDINIKVWS